MSETRDFKLHATLVDRMAGALGVDLEEKMLRGELSFGGLEDAVLACTGCHKPCDCETWLDSQESVAEAAPAYCRNADLFRQLAGG
ncbi:DUF6455 family protein [Salipiger sp. H15]|uniref:DUF6455 family protein n=1 Tax=Alloyangia sp. H15 TaxID=3029062 RepID=A0AAU8AJ48_9RHOB